MSFLTTPDGSRLRFSDRGTGSTFLLIHGWKSSHRLWDLTATRLLAHGHRVVRYDLLGMGESDKPSGPYDFERYADDLGFVIESLGLDDVTLVGWSMGSTVSLRYLERGGTGVGRLVVSNGPLRLTRADDFPHAFTAEEFEREIITPMEQGWPASERTFHRESLLPGSAPELGEWLYQLSLQTPLDVGLEIVRAQARMDMRSAVAGLQIPVLAAWAEKDPYWSMDVAETIASGAPDGHLAVLRESAHCGPIEEPENFSDLLMRFAAGERPGPGRT
jgi:non-heme chloroperoxidase